MSSAASGPGSAIEEKKSNRPSDSAFKQQKLWAWQPILTPGWVIGTFAVTGAVFVALGVAILVASQNVVEVESADYSKFCSPYPCQATVAIQIPEKMTAPVYVYYELDNFYQNHRRYVKSRSDPQLRGDANPSTTLCDPRVSGPSRFAPLAPTGSTPAPNVDKTYYPCGLVAWSQFNDTFVPANQGCTDTYCSTFWTRKGIAWASDVDAKYADRALTSTEQPPYYGWSSDGGYTRQFETDKRKTAAGVTQAVCLGATGGIGGKCKCADKDGKEVVSTGLMGQNRVTSADPSAVSARCYGGATALSDADGFNCCSTATTYATDCICVGVCDVSGSDTICPNRLKSDEEFSVWMRTAALPKFRKIHRVIKSSILANTVLTFTVTNNFPVTAFDGTKRLVLSTTTWIGGKNAFLGWSFIAVAIICILLAVGFGLKQVISPRVLGDRSYLISDRERAAAPGGN